MRTCNAITPLKPARSGFQVVTLATATFMLALPVAAQEVARSQLVIVGDVESVLIGQEGYCGKVERVNDGDLKKIAVPSGKQTWVRHISGGSISGTCSLDFSFTPKVAQAYIVRYTALVDACQAELFRIRPGMAPIPEGLTPETSRSCIFQ